MPERILIEISENMLDKNVKKYIRGNINGNIKNMTDKIVKIYNRRNIRKEYQKICQKEYQKIFKNIRKYSKISENMFKNIPKRISQ